MKNLVAAFLVLTCKFVFADDTYRYFINLNKTVNDKINVELIPPVTNQSEIEFAFPAMVPGTYEIYDFGRFISNFKATGKNGAVIKVEKTDVNTYKLSPAGLIEKISYDVDDTWDKTELPNTKDKIVFEPGGTNFEEGKNFSINTHSMFGFIKGQLNKNFVLEFEKPNGFYPATGLYDIKFGDTKDIITVFDYHDLVDAPIMYALPDTTTINVANTKVLVAAYSPNKKITSRFIANTLTELLNAQKDYLGGNLPVNKYAFLFYFSDRPTMSGSYGALEHSYSSFYVLSEYDSTFLQQDIRDVAAHEFFHIVTPLSIHAKEIGDFDFSNPKMSEHLWLYEGMTEYAAHHAQTKAGIIDVDKLLNIMMQKYENSLSSYNDTMSFTYMSKHVLEDKIHKQYGNVYEKGALISMCLDILLRHYSDGSYGTQDLMKDLATKYGKTKSFNDEDLFNDIEKFTFPEIGAFLRTHVSGTKPLPMREVLDKIGLDFAEESITYEFSLGNTDLDFNEKTNRLFIADISNMDEFGKDLGFKRGDEIAKLNGRELKVDSIREIVTDYYSNLKEGEKVSIDILRPKRKPGKYKTKTLTALARKIKTVRRNQINLKSNVTEKQKQTVKAWVGL